MFKVSNLFRLLFAAAMPMHAFDPNDPADVALLDERIAAAVDPLKAHNKKLLGELKTAKKGAEVDPAEHAALETERDDLAAKLADATKQLGAVTKKADEAAKALEAETGRAQKLQIDGALSAALAAAGVTNPAHAKVTAAMLREQGISVKDGAVVVGEKALDAFVKEWSQSDEGKLFVSAPGNSGGGAPGSGAPAGAANPWDAKTLNLTEQGKILTTNPALAAQMQASASSA